MNDIYSVKKPMSDLQMPWIKELKMFIIFVSMATELTDRQNFTKTYRNSNANYLVCANRNMDMLTHSGKSTSV